LILVALVSFHLVPAQGLLKLSKDVTEKTSTAPTTSTTEATTTSSSTTTGKDVSPSNSPLAVEETSQSTESTKTIDIVTADSVSKSSFLIPMEKIITVDDVSENLVEDETDKEPAEESKNFKRNAIHSEQDSEKMVAAMTDSLSKILNIENKGGRSLSSRDNSGKEPKSGPSPDAFGPVDDLPPVVFPHPATNGRENFIPLPSLDREKVSRHFKQKENRDKQASHNIDKGI